MNLRKNVIRSVLRGARPLFASRRLGIAGRRVLLATLTAGARAPKGTRFQRVSIAGVPVQRVQPPHAATSGTLIYLHGGAYALGSARGYRGLAAQLAAAAGMTALVPDYTRAPHAHYPVALEEMAAVYTRLLDDGLDPKTTVIAGDSAGGGLTLALAMALRDRGIQAPAALGLICPWADLAVDIEATRPALRDPLILPSMCTEWAPRYVGSSDPRLPGISPVYGDMSACRPSSCRPRATIRSASTRTRSKPPAPLRKQASSIAGSRACGTTSICRSVCSPKPATRSPTSGQGCAATSTNRRDNHGE